MNLPFGRSRREAEARRERQVSLTEADINDIKTITETALKTVPHQPSGVDVTSHKGGVIILVKTTYIWRDSAVGTVRKALGTLGYVLADGDAGAGTVVVTGRDPIS